MAAGSSARGLRYARNSVHHDWAQAIDLAQERRHLPARKSLEDWEWVWPLPEKSPGREEGLGEHEYRTRLVGQCVAVTLTELAAAFAAGVRQISDAVPGSVTGEGPFRLGPWSAKAA